MREYSFMVSDGLDWIGLDRLHQIDYISITTAGSKTHAVFFPVAEAARSGALSHAGRRIFHSARSGKFDWPQSARARVPHEGPSLYFPRVPLFSGRSIYEFPSQANAFQAAV